MVWVFVFLLPFLPSVLSCEGGTITLNAGNPTQTFATNDPHDSRADCTWVISADAPYDLNCGVDIIRTRRCKTVSITIDGVKQSCESSFNSITLTENTNPLTIRFKSRWSKIVTNSGLSCTASLSSDAAIVTPAPVDTPSITTSAPSSSPPDASPAPTPAGACTCGVRNSDVTRIVGGVETNLNEIVWQASIHLTRDNFQFCGGSLIAPQWVVTAAHCVNGAIPSDYFVRLGAHNTDITESKALSIGLSQIIVHENYNSKTLQNDIALLKLNSRVTYTTAISPVCLPYNEYQSLDISGKTGTVTGWGTTKSGGTVSSVLMKVDVPLLTRTECQNYGYSPSSIKAGMLCAGVEGKDSCQGDSGGPLVYENTNSINYLFGIVSWGIGCAELGYPGVYTDTRDYITWIETNTQAQADFCVV